MPRFEAGQLCFRCDAFGDAGAEAGVDACLDEDCEVGEVLVFVDDELGEQRLVEEVSFTNLHLTLGSPRSVRMSVIRSETPAHVGVGVARAP